MLQRKTFESVLKGTHSASSNQVAIPSFRNLEDFAPALSEVSFGIIFCNPLETNHLKKTVQKSTFSLVPCSILMGTLSLYNFLSYFVIFPLLFLFLFIKYLKLYRITLRGTKLVYLDIPLSSPSNTQCNSILVM